MKKYSTITKTIYKEVENDVTSEEILIIRYKITEKRHALMHTDEINFIKSKYEKSKLFAKVIAIPDCIEIRFNKDVVFFDCEYTDFVEYENATEELYEFRKYLKNMGYKVITLSMFLDKRLHEIGIKNGELARDRYN